jgi:hypothetical protein|nr:MAG TPA: hypothetical protein [Caudoviricetes sp.]
MLNIDLDGDVVSYLIEVGGKKIVVRIVSNVMHHSHFDIIAATDKKDKKEKKEISHKATFYFEGERIKIPYNDKTGLENLMKEEYYQNLPDEFKNLAQFIYELCHLYGYPNMSTFISAMETIINVVRLVSDLAENKKSELPSLDPIDNLMGCLSRLDGIAPKDYLDSKLFIVNSEKGNVHFKYYLNKNQEGMYEILLYYWVNSPEDMAHTMVVSDVITMSDTPEWPEELYVPSVYMSQLDNKYHTNFRILMLPVLKKVLYNRYGINLEEKQ